MSEEARRGSRPGKRSRDRGGQAVFRKTFDSAAWDPRTELGRKVKAGTITDIDEILDSGARILEAEIVDTLLPDLSVEMLMIGQAKGKFGGGQRRSFRQTQKKTSEGNKPSFGTLIVVGHAKGYVGIGQGKSRETVPSREKAIRNAKLSVMRIPRGCGSWQCHCKTSHSIPIQVTGKCGSVIISLIPAPKGTGLRVAPECRKMLAAAGIKDVWSSTEGHTRTTINLVKACFEALRQLNYMRMRSEQAEALGVVEAAV
jgi:small subunit ribosomal protein S5